MSKKRKSRFTKTDVNAICEMQRKLSLKVHVIINYLKEEDGKIEHLFTDDAFPRLPNIGEDICLLDEHDCGVWGTVESITFYPHERNVLIIAKQE